MTIGVKVHGEVAELRVYETRKHRDHAGRQVRSHKNVPVI